MVIMSSRALVDATIFRVADLIRSVDVLTSRDDIRADRLAYYGFSWGGRLGPLALAVDPRFVTGVLLDGGISRFQVRPEVATHNYAVRVDVPVLMVNGLHDHIFPLESSQKALFELLGTAPEHKRHVTYPGGHVVLALYRNHAIGEILDWLDTYLGPVN
jgi:cephalosporin-C deacetylase-like acetyl esterase